MPPQSLPRKIALVTSCHIAVLALAGCSITPASIVTAGSAQPAAAPTVSGSVHGGQQPVSGASVQLWAVNTNGAAATSLLTSTVTTDSQGTFNITGKYTCPTPSSQIYITANGGNPGLGAGTNNGALSMLAALGSCSTLTPSTFININEVTTVASVWALQQFIGVNYGTAFSETIGVDSSPLATVGLVNAFSTVQNLASTSTGYAGPTASNASTEITKIYTIANILASCVNSDGTTACATLFNAVTPTGQTLAADIIQAALYMAQFPVNNVTAVYNLQAATPPFQPNLSSAPFDWTIAITYTGSGLNIPYLLAADAAGNQWIVNAAGSTSNGLVELGPTGQPASGSPFLTGSGTPISGPQTVAVDTLGNVWNAEHGSSANSVVEYVPSSNTYTKRNAVSSCLPQSLAIDGSNNVFFACSGITNLFEFANTGTVSSPTYNSSATQLGAVGSTPYGTAIDTLGNVWVTGNGSANVTELPAGNLSAPVTFATGTTPYGVAIDHSNNVWVAGSQNSNLTELTPSGGSYTTSTFTGGGLANPRYLAVDGNGNIWVTNNNPTTVGANTYISFSEFDNDGNPLSPASGTNIPGGYAKLTTATQPTPRGISIDPSGNVWMTGCSSVSNCLNNGSFVMELVGAASPVVTPYATAVGANQLGCCGITPPSPGAAAPSNPAGSLTLQAASYSPVQNYGSFAFAVNRVSGTTGAVTVHYATSNGTATAGTDYTAQSGTLSWAAGDTAVKTITVPWLVTSNYAGTKTFNVTLSTPTGGATLGSFSSTLVTVTDNLAPPSGSFNFSKFKLGLPVDIYGGTGGINSIQFASATIQPSTLNAGFSDKYFYLDASHHIVFTAPSNGATTTPGSGSDHTRSELRELYTGTGADSNSDWNSTIGGTMTATLNVTQVAASSDEATIGQIHEQDVVFMLLEYRPTQKDLAVSLYASPTNSTSTRYTVISNVNLNDTISYSIGYINNTLTVTATDGANTNTRTFDVSAWAGTPVYFKIGAYHAAPHTGNSASDQTQVVISSFSVTH